jgi:hypothetical protein
LLVVAALQQQGQADHMEVVRLEVASNVVGGSLVDSVVVDVHSTHLVQVAQAVFCNNRDNVDRSDSLVADVDIQEGAAHEGQGSSPVEVAL